MKTAPGRPAHKGYRQLVAQNIIANFLGKLWLFVITFVAVPVYLAFVGVEAFGLIGFFSILLATVQVLELGLGVVINREVATDSLVARQISEHSQLIQVIGSDLLDRWTSSIACHLPVCAIHPQTSG